MNIAKSFFRFLVQAILITGPMSAYAQSEISRRTELQTGTAVPIQAGTVSTRDVPAPEIGIRGVVIGSMPALGTALPPGSRTFTNEVEIITFGYKIPDFNPDDLYTHHYHFGMFAENGNGSGTAYPDIDGYVEYEMHHPIREPEMQTFLYSIHAETGEAKVFIDVNELTVNRAVSILTNVGINSGMNTARYNRTGTGFPPRPAFRMPAEIGNQRRMELHGDYLTLEDIQEEIFRQTRCNVEEEDGHFYLESCQ
jgi:hypothetical protein